MICYQLQGCLMPLKSIFFVILLGLFSFKVSAISPKLTAEEILTQVAKTYRQIESYSDKGVVKTLFFTESGKRLDEKPFATDFVRKENFRFEFSNKHPFLFSPTYKSIIFGLGNNAVTWRSHKLGEDNVGINKEESLDMAIAGATGISGGSAYDIPALLQVSGIGKWKNTLVSYPFNERLTDEQWRESTFYKIEVKRPNKNSDIKGEYVSEILWIDPKTFLIHRIDSATEFKNFRTQNTTLYNPRIGIEIPAERFVPPQAN